MNNRDHCRVTQLLLGIKPHPELHRFMDGYTHGIGWSPKKGRRDYKVAKFMEDLYGEEAGLEATLHIACDLKLITKQDVELWAGIIIQSPPRKKNKSRFSLPGT